MYDVRTERDQESSQGTTTLDRRFMVVYSATGDVVEVLGGCHTERPDGSVGNEGYESISIDGDDLVLTEWDGKVTRRPLPLYFVRTTSKSDNPYGYTWEEWEYTLVHAPTGIAVDTFKGSYTERPHGTSSEGVQKATIDGGTLVLKDSSGADTRVPLPERALVSDGEVVFGYADGRTVSRRRV